MQINAKGSLDLSGIPADLRGKRVIDVGAADGAYTFEFARRGASILAIDIQPPDNTGFGIASKLAATPVEHRVISVYDLAPDIVGKFDIAWYWGVFYHLKEPLLAFRNLHQILKADGLLCFEGAILDGVTGDADPRLAGIQDYLAALSNVPLTYFTHGSFANDWSNWYVPNLACLREWLGASGFKDIHVTANPPRTRCVGTAVKNSAFVHREYPRRRQPPPA